MISRMLLIFTVIMFHAFLHPGDFTLRDGKSTIHLSAGTTFVIDNQISNYIGILEKEEGASIVGQGIVLNKGTFFDGDKKFSISGKIKADSNNEIELSGNKKFKGKGLQVSQDIKISGADNRLEGELVVLSDVELQDVNTTATLALTRRFNKNINLNNGEIFLEENLSLIDGKKIIGPGTVKLNKRKLILGSEELAFDQPLYFDNGNDIELNSNLYLSSTWTFSGQSNTIRGNGFTIFMNGTGRIVVEHGSSLLIHKVKLEEVGGVDVCCMDNAATLSMQSVVLCLDEDFTFSLGSLQIKDYLDINGSYTFAFQTAMTSTIQKNSSLTLSQNLTFSYDPFCDRMDLLCFEDSSSRLYMNNATLHITNSGMRLIKGSGIVEGFCKVETEMAFNKGGNYISGGLEFGNQQVGNDFSLEILRGSYLEMVSGLFSFRNVSSSSWNMNSTLSSIKLLWGTAFELQESLNLGQGRLFCSKRASLTKYPGKTLTGEVSITA